MNKHITKLGEKLADWFGETSDYGVEMKSPVNKKLNAYLEEYAISTLLPYESYDTTTKLYHNRNSLGFVLMCQPLCGADPKALNALSTLLKDKLPEFSTFHALLYANPHISPIVQSWSNHRTRRDEEIYHKLASERKHYIVEGATNRPLRSEKTIFRDFQLIIDVTLPLDLDEKKALDYQRECVDSLEQLQIHVSFLNSQELLYWLYPLINPTLSNTDNIPTYDENDSLALQMVEPGLSLQVTPQGLIFDEGRKVVKTVRITDYPKHWDQWRMGDLIGDAFNNSLRLSCPFLISFVAYIPSTDKEKTRAHAKSLRAGQQANSALSRFLPQIRLLNDEWKYAVSKLEEGDRFIKTNCQISLYGTKETIAEHEAALAALLQHKEWKFSPCRYIQLPAWLMNFPMTVTTQVFEEVKNFHVFKTMLASNVPNVIPLQGETKGGNSPLMMLIGRRGQVIFWDPFANSSGNYNVTIAAKSGAGKSVFTQEYILASVGSGGKVWIIDVGRSYEKLVDLVGGQFIVFSDKSNISLNPFSNIQDLYAEGHLQLLKPLFAQMASPNEALPILETSYIEKAITDSWEKHNKNTTVTHIAEWLNDHEDKRARDVGSQLYTYTDKGMYGHYFSGPCTLDFSNPLLCLELEELKGKKDLQSVVLLLLMYQVTQAMYLGDRSVRMSCIIDEAWDLLAGVQGAGFIEEGCRRARKYNGNFITCTQSVNDYFKNPAAKAAYENSDHQVFLAHKPEAIDQYQKDERLNVNPYEEKCLRSLNTLKGQYAEVFIRGGNNSTLLGRLMLDPFSSMLYSTTGEDFVRIKQLKSQGKTVTEAIKYLQTQHGIRV